MTAAELWLEMVASRMIALPERYVRMGYEERWDASMGLLNIQAREIISPFWPFTQPFGEGIQGGYF